MKETFATLFVILSFSSWKLESSPVREIENHGSGDGHNPLLADGPVFRTTYFSSEGSGEVEGSGLTINSIEEEGSGDYYAPNNANIDPKQFVMIIDSSETFVPESAKNSKENENAVETVTDVFETRYHGTEGIMVEDYHNQTDNIVPETIYVTTVESEDYTARVPESSVYSTKFLVEEISSETVSHIADLTPNSLTSVEHSTTLNKPEVNTPVYFTNFYGRDETNSQAYPTKFYGNLFEEFSFPSTVDTTMSSFLAEEFHATSGSFREPQMKTNDEVLENSLSRLFNIDNDNRKTAFSEKKLLNEKVRQEKIHTPRAPDHRQTVYFEPVILITSAECTSCLLDVTITDHITNNPFSSFDGYTDEESGTTISNLSLEEEVHIDFNPPQVLLKSPSSSLVDGTALSSEYTDVSNASKQSSLIPRSIIQKDGNLYFEFLANFTHEIDGHS